MEQDLKPRNKQLAPDYANACTTCRFASTCRDIVNKLHQIKSNLRLQEEEVVAFHTLCLYLHANGFHFPYSPRPCKFATSSSEQLHTILQFEDDIITIQNAS